MRDKFASCQYTHLHHNGKNEQVKTTISKENSLQLHGTHLPSHVLYRECKMAANVDCDFVEVTDSDLDWGMG